eukprot:6557492-Prymnesium_polylepis.1
MSLSRPTNRGKEESRANPMLPRPWTRTVESFCVGILYSGVRVRVLETGGLGLASLTFQHSARNPL